MKHKAQYSFLEQPKKSFEPNICLKNSIFKFGGKLYKQLIGTAMGIHPAPSYANIFMAKIDDQIVKLANTYKITEDLEKISG